MLDLSNLYSLNRQEPQPLSWEIMLSDGRSRTDNTTFTEEEIRDAGFTGPYAKPIYDELTYELTWDSENLKYIATEIPQVEKPVEEVYIPSEEFLWQEVRNIRNYRLKESDYTMLPDIKLSENDVKLWKEYRQKLRDFPSTIEDIHNYTWPEPPQ